MLVSLIFGGASSSETAEEDEGDEDNAEESGSSTGEEETFRSAYAEVGEAPSVEQIDASPALGSLRGESEGPELETDITPSEPGNAELADPTDPLPIVPIAQRSQLY